MTSNDDILKAVNDLSIAVATMRVELQDYKEKVDSDIRELKGKHRDAMQSITDITEAEAADAKASRDKWVEWVVKVGTALLLVIAGWLIAKAGLH